LNYRARRNVLAAVVFLSAALFGSSAWAGTKTWNGSVSTDWNNAANWTGGLPGVGDLAVIPPLSAIIPPIVVRLPTITNVPPNAINQLQVLGGATLTINNARVLTINNATSPAIDGTGTVVTAGGGLLTVTGGVNNGVLINDTMTLGAFTLNATVGRNMGIPSGKTVTFNGAVNITSSEIHVGAAAGAASTLDINGTLTLAAAGTLDMRAPASIMRLSGNLTYSGTFTPGSSTVILDPTANQTLTLNAATYSFFNLTIQTDAGANQISGDLITPNVGFTVSGDLTITRGQFQIGAFTVDVLGNLNSGDPAQAQLDFFNSPGTIRVKGNVDVASVSQVTTGTTGPFATFILNGTTPQTFRIRASTASAYHDLDTFRVSNPAGVTVLNNPNADFIVNGTLTVDAGCSLTVQDSFNPQGPVVMAAGGGNTLRIEGAIIADGSPLGSSFAAGTGTVIYAGQGVPQTVYTVSGTSNPIAYNNLVIDNTVGMMASQQANGVVLDVNGNFVIQTANASFTSANGNMTAAKNFTDNGNFVHNGATVTMDGTGAINGTAASLIFNNLLINGLTTDVVTAARSFTTNNTFQVVQGALTSAGTAPSITLTAQLGMTVGNGAGAAGTAAFNLRGTDTLAIAPTRTFSVNATDGRFTSLGVGPPYDNSQARNPTLTCSAAGTFTATVNGQADVYGLNFSHADYQGLNFTATATLQRLRNVRFTSISAVSGAPGRHLSISVPGLDLDCPGCYFESATVGFYNVWANGAGLRLRFEDRRSSGSTAYNGPGAGEAFDGDDDANDDGVISGAAEVPGTHAGAMVQWVYTANIDMSGVIQGFPMPAFDFNNFGAYYSTYVIMRQGANIDTIYVLNSQGDIAYQLPSLGAGSGFIVGPLWWDTEGATHVIYFGTSTGRVYKFIDNGSSLQQPASGVWATHFSDASLTAVNSWIISDQTNLYFGGANGATNGIYAVQISTKTKPVAWPISTTTRAVTTAPSWFPTSLGSSLFQASNAVGSVSNIYRVKTGAASIDATFTSTTPATLPVFVPALGPPVTTVDYCTTSFVAPTNVAFNNILYVGESNGWMHALPALGTALQFLAPAPGFPFRDKVSAITGGATYDFIRGRIFFGNAAGDVYVLGTYNGSWRIGPAVPVTNPNPNYFRLATPGGNPITSAPLYEDGVLYVSSNSGRVFVIDADSTTGATPLGPVLMRTYNLGSNVLSDPSRDYTTSRFYVGTAGGRLYSIDQMTNPAGTLQ
jgi:hypothetical protein